MVEAVLCALGAGFDSARIDEICFQIFFLGLPYTELITTKRQSKT
jgi:hypothetical protein